MVQSTATAKDAFGIAVDVGNPLVLAAARAAVAMALAAEGSDEARGFVSDHFIAEARDHDRTLGLVRLLEASASVSLAEGCLERALSEAQELKTVASRAGLRPDVVRSALLEGQALLRLQRRPDARDVLERGVALAREIGLRPLLMRLLFWLSQAQESAGHSTVAAESVFEAAELARSLGEVIEDEALRASFLEAAACQVVLQRAERLERAGLATAGARSGSDPDVVAADVFRESARQAGGDAPLRTLLTHVVDRAVESIRADRGLLLLLDADSVESAEVCIARNRSGESIEGPAAFCREILEGVSRGQPCLVEDPGQDDRFAAVESVRLEQIRSLMCLPLEVSGQVIGALYFDVFSDQRSFRSSDLELMTAFASQVASAIDRARRERRLREQSARQNLQQACKYRLDSLVGESEGMRRLFSMMEAVIRADCNVLVVGESGTGKELVARAIHFGGRRKSANFVPVDCGAIPESLIESELFGHRKGAFSGADSDKKGLFEEADGGTLFLDEIANTTPGFQAKLLRALQAGEFRRLGETLTRRADVRVIAATNADVDQAIEQGLFREDLYYRLNVVTLHLPPLRERCDDIELLASHFARRACEARGMPFRGIQPAALARLKAHAWPGNVRELENAIEAALVMSDDGFVTREGLPDRVRGDDVDEVRDLLHEQVGGESAAERARVEEALSRAGGDKSRAARILGWNRMKLYRRMKSLGISYDLGKTSS